MDSGVEEMGMNSKEEPSFVGILPELDTDTPLQEVIVHLEHAWRALPPESSDWPTHLLVEKLKLELQLMHSALDDYGIRILGEDGLEQYNELRSEIAAYFRKRKPIAKAPNMDALPPSIESIAVTTDDDASLQPGIDALKMARADAEVYLKRAIIPSWMRVGFEGVLHETSLVLAAIARGDKPVAADLQFLAGNLSQFVYRVGKEAENKHDNTG